MSLHPNLIRESIREQEKRAEILSGDIARRKRLLGLCGTDAPLATKLVNRIAIDEKFLTFLREELIPQAKADLAKAEAERAESHA